MKCVEQRVSVYNAAKRFNGIGENEVLQYAARAAKRLGNVKQCELNGYAKPASALFAANGQCGKAKRVPSAVKECVTMYK